ncbi:MAG TPA: hypothetical protein PLW80_03140 [Spirochaetales bacterium]|nr:hypothetical protein [Spirochaetales bacterium]HPB65528.1 hypothetical protein [Spirochaetales bacterium]HPG85575.1 hypothetical protein [Spirochaetales bacterium]HPM72110.1 hypothetical protein [Spirochaetales bacterium]
MRMRSALAKYEEAIVGIYNPYVTTITFEETPVGANEMGERIVKNGGRLLARF